MSLDIFTEDQRAAEAFAGNNLARNLPATFSEAFDTSWREGLLFGQSIASTHGRIAAIEDYVDEVARRTGQRIVVPNMDEAFHQGGPLPDRVGFINNEVRRIAAERPDIKLDELTEEEIDRRAIQLSRAARQDATEMAIREKTWGGTFGGLLGSGAAAVADPVNIVALPIGAPVGAGILRTALAWGAIAGGSQAAIEAIDEGYRERVQPGYAASSEPAANIVGAGAFGALVGGGLKGLSAAWSRVKSGSWPRTVRDAGNVVESEAQVARSNPFDGAEGEIAHREAVSKATDDLLNDRPVNVDDLLNNDIGRAYDLGPLYEARDRVNAGGRLAEAGDALGDMAWEIQRIAQRAGHEMPRQQADLLADRIARLPDDEARGVLDEIMLRPSTIADVFPERPPAGAERPAPTAFERAALDEMATNATLSRQRDIRNAPETADAVALDVARLRAERPNVQVPVGETIGKDGKVAAVFRSADDIASEFDARMAAANEIELCARAA
jgi:hypothetical protein